MKIKPYYIHSAALSVDKKTLLIGAYDAQIDTQRNLALKERYILLIIEIREEGNVFQPIASEMLLAPFGLHSKSKATARRE